MIDPNNPDGHIPVKASKEVNNQINGMRYSSTNRPEDFEFHDAELSLVSWDATELIVTAEFLNIHKDAAPDNSGTDMEISEARITFYGFQIKNFTPSALWKTDESGKSYAAESIIVHTGSAARNMFENELRNSITVLFMNVDDGIYKLGAVGMDPCFSACFVFDSIKIEWNDYRGKAWYVRDFIDSESKPKQEKR